MKYKNIFITGSTGVVGKPLLKKLIENGHNVYALSRSEENNKILESQGVSVISGNVLTSNLIGQFENIDIDAIFHVAGVNNCLLYTSPSPRDAHESRMPSSA